MIKKIAKSFFGAAFTGIVITLLVFAALLQYEQWNDRKLTQYYATRPITDIFEASVFVPDFSVGDNPLVVYENQKHEAFVGDFTVEVKSVDNTVNCRGEGRNVHYEPTDMLDSNNTTLSWFIGREAPPECWRFITPGTYMLDVNYTIKQENRPTRYYRIKSNYFEVTGIDKFI